MSYKYINGYYEVTTDIRNGFKRFHTMNAQYKFERFGWDDNYWFISYNTPILWATYSHVTDKWHIVINWESYDCSTSTIRQLTRFMRESGMPISHVYDLRNAFATNAHVTVFGWGDIEWCTTSKLESTMF
jgi:hypothetical protein